MVFVIIRSFIGSVGRAMMDFYIANSFIINGILLFYALVVYVSHRNYLNVLQKIFIELDLIKDGEKDKLIRKLSNADYKKISWEELRKKIWFPLISPPGKMSIRFCTTKYIMDEFTAENINSYINQIKKKD